MEPAFVLHRWPYQDSSLLLELFSAEQGRFRAIAKGAKRPKSPWRSILQPFTPLQISTRGRHELQTLVAAEALDSSLKLSGTALYSGFYVNELVQRLTTPYHLVDGLFQDYRETLELLTQVTHVEPILRRFEWQLLCHLGHGFDWHMDTQEQPISATQTYQFIPEAGFSLTNAEEQADVLLLSGADIIRLSDFAVSEQRLLNLFKRLMRVALQPYLGPQPLRSRQLFVQFKDLS
ncbi:DNA repair protein RecO [Pseudidiomarina tainanensis]|uniref:DNA repair protein RecO n=1 Tax=Pseudidiomarina tainanensis TaxID=502365 RepID=A0ACD2HJG6_9GAMM|nr:DNA repair protein RecO [Pseudidiomarina tainanensis]RZQ56710.1 DNA repair protein RecO [Pseudidiomarina tainanensis]